MDNKLSNIMPVDSDEADAYSVLMLHPRAEDFMDAIQRQPDGSWVMTIPCGGQVYTFKDDGPGALRRLAVEYITFNPERERQREAEKRAAERTAADKQALLRHALLGSGGESNGSF